MSFQHIPTRLPSPSSLGLPFGKPAATSVLLSSLVTSLSLWYLTLRCYPGELILPCHITSASTEVHDPTFSRSSYHLTSSAFSDFFVNFFPVVWNAPGHFWSPLPSQSMLSFEDPTQPNGFKPKLHNFEFQILPQDLASLVGGSTLTPIKWHLFLNRFCS